MSERPLPRWLVGCPLDASYAAAEPQWIDGQPITHLCPQHMHAMPIEVAVAGSFATIERCKICGGSGRYRAREVLTPDEMRADARPAIDFFACTLAHLERAKLALPEGRACRAVRWIPCCDFPDCDEDASCRVIEVDAHYQGRVGVRKNACELHREVIALHMLRKGLSAKFFDLHPSRKA